MAWAWGDPWPGTPGGAQSPSWGRLVRLYVQAAIAPGASFKLGPAPTDQLDAGNVLGPVTGTGQSLWVDLTCDTLTVEITQTAAESDVVAQADAATLSLALIDPTRKYDPLNPDTPYRLNGVSRMVPNQPVRVFVEMVNPTTNAITTYYLFTGTSDSWAEDWTPHPEKRRAKLQASGYIKDLQQLNYEEQPPTGTGDLVHERLNRILTYFGWTKPKNLGTSAVALQSTTLAQPAWELIQRAADDEIGYVYVSTDGTLTFLPRTTWRTTVSQNANYRFGCEIPGFWDVVIDVSAEANVLNVKNRISAAASGGTSSVVQSDASIALYGIQSYKRTDLGLKDKSGSDAWATFVLEERAFPRANVSSFTIAPKLDESSWPYVFEICRDLASSVIQLYWRPSVLATPYSLRARVFGFQMDIDRHHWTVDLQVSMQETDVKLFHMGAHPFDKLNDGNRLG